MVPNGDMGDGELSRDGKRLAVTSDYGANKKLTFFAVNQPAPAYPDFACETTTGDERYSDPSWAPDGVGLAYESSKGIEITHFTQFGKELCATAGDVLLSATGSEPDWGQSDPPAAAYKLDTPETNKPNTTTPATAPAAKFVALKVTAKALKRGLAVKVEVPAAGKVTVTASVAGRKVASGRATAKAAGTVTVKLSKVKRSLKGSKLTLKLSFKDTTKAMSVKVA
jgi:hypothetical protein